jgi:hypothetical protein
VVVVAFDRGALQRAALDGEAVLALIDLRAHLPLNASAAMNKTVQDQNGAVIQSLTLFRNNRNMTALTEQASSIIP